jgi:periplasmic protein TonB
MQRPLFDDLVLSGRGGRAHTRAGVMPLSVALHAAGLTALLAASMVVRDAMPMPTPPGLSMPIPPRVFQAAGPAAATTRVAPPRHTTAAPSFQTRPSTPTALQTLPDESMPIGDRDPDAGGACIGCAPAPIGLGALPTGDPAGTGSAAADPAPIRPGGRIQPPVKTRNVDPVYPELARNAHVAGIVILECIIDRDGRVESVTVLRGHPLLNSAATDAVRQWRYRPTLLNGVPVEVVMTVTVRFTTR